MKKLGIFLPLLAVVAATPAAAQNVGIAARVEGRVGYDEVRSDIRFQNSTFADDFGISDVNFGLEAGVDAHIFRGILVGGYVGIETSNVDGCVENPFFTRTTSRRDNVCVDAGRNVYAGGRLGIPVGGNGLIYAKGGVSRGRFEGSYAVTVAAAGQRVGPVFNGSDTVSGYHFGGGFELDVASNFYVKGEYVQHRYDDAFTDLLNTDTADPNPLRRTDRFNPMRHQLVFGVGYRFGSRRAD
jgi:outer membrane immunogenic protein